MARCEYKVIKAPAPGIMPDELEEHAASLEATLNREGRDGWILAAAVSSGSLLVLVRTALDDRVPDPDDEDDGITL